MQTDRRTDTIGVCNSPFSLISVTEIRVILINWKFKLIINLCHDEDIQITQDLCTYSLDPNVSPTVC